MEFPSRRAWRMVEPYAQQNSNDVFFPSAALLSPHHHVLVVALSCVGTKRNGRSTVVVAAAAEACLGFTTGPSSPLPWNESVPFSPEHSLCEPGRLLEAH